MPGLAGHGTGPRAPGRRGYHRPGEGRSSGRIARAGARSRRRRGAAAGGDRHERALAPDLPGRGRSGAPAALRRAGVGGLRGRAGHAGIAGRPAGRGGAGGLPRGAAGGRGPAGRAPARGPGCAWWGSWKGDRFERRLDVEGLQARGLAVVDTTNGSSYPVSEWALGLILVALRNAGAHFRRLIAGEVVRQGRDEPGYLYGELTGQAGGADRLRAHRAPPAGVPAPLQGGRAGLRPLPGPRGAGRLRLPGGADPGAGVPGVRGGGLPGPPDAPHAGDDRGPGAGLAAPGRGLRQRLAGADRRLRPP